MPALLDQIEKFRAEGYRYIRVQLAVPGYSGYGVSAQTADEIQSARPTGVAPSPVFEPTPYINNTIRMFEQLRAKIGFDVELLHDVHERVPPNQAIQLCKAVEPYRPFFMEDPFAPKTSLGFAHYGSRLVSHRHGRVVRQSQRMGVPGCRTADRFHPHTHLRSGRFEHGAKGGVVL